MVRMKTEDENKKARMNKGKHKRDKNEKRLEKWKEAIKKKKKIRMKNSKNEKGYNEKCKELKFCKDEEWR